jgi:hypothetical protein
LDFGLWVGWTEFPALPETDDAEPGLLPELCVADLHPDEWRIVCGQLGDLQPPELANHVGLGLPDVDAIGEVGAELVLQRLVKVMSPKPSVVITTSVQ